MSRLPAVPGTIAPGKEGLSAYLSQIRHFPLLKPEEEYMLAKRWKEHQDARAAERLITSHLRLVAKIANGYRGYNLPPNEIISEGNVGLMHAVHRFDPEKGVRLSTYAVWWIRAAIKEYIVRSWSLVKIGTTAAQKKLFFNLGKMKNRAKIMNDSDLSPELVKQISKDLKVPEHEVISMNQRMTGDSSLHAPRSVEAESGEWIDFLEDDEIDQETDLVLSEQKQIRHQMLLEAMEILTDREKEILTQRRLVDKPQTLEQLSQQFGVTRERIRQIEVKAFEKVQSNIMERVGQEEVV